MSLAAHQRTIYRPSVFVSSTNEDLLPDCRPKANEAITLAGGYPVTQENFIYTHHQENALTYCLKKIEAESSHYIGIFAHRQGWVPLVLPPEYQAYQGLSVTQAEYHHALNLGLDVAVFIPKTGTALDLELMKRVKNQDPKITQAQDDFVKHVRKTGLLNEFDDIERFAMQVIGVVYEWKSLGKQSLMDFAEQSSPPILTTPTLGHNIFALGRFKHLRVFANSLDMWTNEKNYSAACFRIAGAKGMGHDALVERIRQKLGETGEVFQLAGDIVRLGLGQHKDVQQLLERLSKGMKDAPQTIAQLGEILAVRLERTHILLVVDIRSIAERFIGGISNLITNVWSPLIKALKGHHPFQLVILLVEESELVSDIWKTLLYDEDAPFDPTKVIDLPRLEPFTSQEIADWLTREIGDDPRAEIIGKALHDMTQGHPDDLYIELREITSYEGVLE